MKKHVFLLIFALLLRPTSKPTYAAEASNPNIHKLLEGYRQSLSWQESVSMNIGLKANGEINGERIPITSERYFTFHRDHRRVEWLGKKLQKDDNNNIDLDYCHIIKTIMNGDTFAKLTSGLDRPPIGALIDRNRESYNNNLNKMLRHPTTGGPLWGRMYGSNQKNVADLLFESSSPKLREEKENINGTLCYVVEATTEYGKVTIWIAPEKGYNALKWSIQKGLGDLFNQKPLSANSWLAEFVVDDLQQVGDFWVTKAGRLIFKIDYNDKTSRHTETTIYEYNVNDIQINPNFETLGAFKIDFPNGTPVQIVQAPGIRYVWQDGKPVSVVDDSFLDDLDIEIEQLKTEVKAEPARSTDKKAKVTRDELAPIADTRPDTQADTAETQQEVPSESAFFPILVLILIGLLIIGVIGWLLFRQLKRG